jgi:Mlc titration factor MtfA (ptsG expression regulator)
MFGYFKRRRRAKVAARPFPPQWQAVLDRLPMYTRLPDADRHELRTLVSIFLSEKRFEGCAGLEITDEIRVTIAAQACVLLLRRQTDIYPKLTSILVYPATYVATFKRPGPGGIVTEGAMPHAGESWNGLYSAASGGPIVLSWRDVRRGAACASDGNNVVFHEFAHQLDSEDGEVNGAPVLDDRSHYIAWARVLGEKFTSLHQDLAKGDPAWINPYAATNPAEFFAVLTEFFFERPRTLLARHPLLYAQLASFYKQDPAQWPAPDDCPDLTNAQAQAQPAANAG